MRALLFAAALSAAQAGPIQVGDTVTGPAVALGGDTLLMAGAQGKSMRVRLYGLAAPEMAAPLGPQARAALDELIAGGTVDCLVLDKDSRGRLVAACDVDGANLSEAVLRAGLGTAYRIFTYAAGADADLAARLDAAEAAARAAGLGLWATTMAAPASKWWEDWRAIEVAMAFFGFFFGTWWAHHLAGRREERRRAFEAEQAKGEREEVRRQLALLLHAEILWLWRVTNWYADHKPEHADLDFRFALALEGEITRLGRLGDRELIEKLLTIHGLGKTLAHQIGSWDPLHAPEDETTIRENCRTVTRLCREVDAPLATIASVAPHWPAPQEDAAA